MLLCFPVKGQVPDPAPPPRKSTPGLPPAYPANIPVNYIRLWHPDRSWRDAHALQQDAATIVSTRYFDGLGRVLQTVDKGKSPARGDIVSIVMPEVRGSAERAYLPYNIKSGNGRFRRDAFVEQLKCWSGMQGEEQVFFGSKSYDPSPGKQLRSLLAAGNSWQGSGRGQRYGYHSQTQADEVAQWKIDLRDDALPVFAGMFAPGELLKEVSADENGKQLITFKDREGRMVLRKVPLALAPGKGHSGYACTYFVYDGCGNLRCVLPPKMVELLCANSWRMQAGWGAELCFRFVYDARGRRIFRKAPGTAGEAWVFDARDRMILHRKGNLGADGRRWMATVYDALNRPVMTGVYTTNLTDAALGSHMQKDIVLPAGKFDTLTRTFYDHYLFPGAHTASHHEIEKVRQAGGAGGDFHPFHDSPKGKVTGMWVRVIGKDRWLVHTLRYDRKMRLTQQSGELYNGGTETVTRLYDFRDRPVVVRHLQSHPRSRVLSCVQSRFTYDHAGRLLTTTLRLNDQPALQRTIATMEYGPSGELIRKSFPRSSGGILESLHYTYNIRGWLTGINAGWLKATGPEPHFFGQALYYDHGFSNREYNGNIAGLRWKGFNTAETRAYGFSYDGADRLLQANYTQYADGVWNKAGGNFDVQLGNGADPFQAYDANGNIRRMRHWGTRGVQHALLLDDLRFQYDLPASGKYGNQLLGVTDLVKAKAPVAGDFTDDPQASLSDYGYDANGNLVRDANRGIANIRWNLLDLPEEIILTGKGKIHYLYDAAGNKLSQSVIRHDSGNRDTIRMDYMSGFVYRNDTLQYFLHGEGRVRPGVGGTGAVGFAWDYFVRDHLGNVRMVLTDEQVAAIYQATMEPVRAGLENRLFSQVDAVRGNVPAGYPKTQGVSNTAVARLNGKDPARRAGPGLVLKVMAGDTLQIGVKAFYTSPSGSATQPVAPLEEMMRAVLGVFSGGMPGVGKGGGADGTVSPFADKLTGEGWRRLQQREPVTQAGGRPGAYLNYLLFDEQLNLVGDQSGVKQVAAAPGKLQVLGNGPAVMKRSGYLYVFLSNESPQDVYFDDLTVTMRHGPVMEETHYYPFGLAMPGISVRAMRAPLNRIRFNGKALQQIDVSGVVEGAWYDYGARMYDPQIGRWLSPDKLSEQYESVSPYAYALNDPVNSVDPDGNLVIFVNGFMIHQWMAQDHRLMVQTAQRSMVDRGTYLTSYTAQRNPNYSPYPGERTFATGAPTYLGEPFQYWGKIDDVFMQAHQDYNARYISASADNASQAHERYADGAMAARRLIRQLDNRQIPLAGDETIKIVGHSQGAAFAAGMVSVLGKHAKYSSRLEIAYYIAPHQPGDFLHHSKVKGQQWSTFNDWVTDGWNLIHLFNGGSKNQKIEGVENEQYIRRTPWTQGMGGHYVETYLEDIIHYFQHHGVTVNVH